MAADHISPILIRIGVAGSCEEVGNGQRPTAPDERKNYGPVKRDLWNSPFGRSDTAKHDASNKTPSIRCWSS